MRTTLKSYLALTSGETYLILDEDKKEIGKLTVNDEDVSIEINEAISKLKEDALPEWFESRHYLISKVSPRWVDFNPNPIKNSKANDCTIRAYCAAENIDWDEAYDIASKRGKNCAFMPNDKSAVQEIIKKDLCYTHHKLKKDEKGITVSEFAIKHDTGTFLVMIARHLVAVVNGKYYDSWDSGDKKVSCYYEKQ